MAKEILNKEIAEKLAKVEGKLRGMSFKSEAKYITSKEGEVGLKKVEEKLAEVGCPLKYSKIIALGYYPLGWRSTALLAIRDSFGWGDEEMRKLGAFVAHDSIIIRIYSSFFHSLESLVGVASRIYNEYFTIGELNIPDYSEEKKYMIVEMKDLDLHPIFCCLFEGYLAAIIKMVINPKKIRCREVKGASESHKRHQFKVTWE